MAIEVIAPAKVNLALHVTGRRPDGYHLLDSLVVFADLGDRLRIEAAQTLSLAVTGPFAAGVPTDGTNLVLKAAVLMAGKGARITLDKQLPHGGGIGGGSSDAAATLRALSRLWDAPLPGATAVLSLGADVPVCLMAPAPQRMRGIGEDLTPVPALPAAYLVLVNPGVPVPTREVFARLAAGAGTDNHGLSPLTEAPDFDAFADWLHAQRNDLEAPAIATAPVITKVLAAVRKTEGCALARMSGSGSTVFGLFRDGDAAAKAAARIGAEAPGWWARAARIL
ncbi:MAG TPA: 4-(cytidine 5'-diphospho)-2-C-methyl-D-erythritol kinase [Albidovulum sp.]|uniref:4-(cytidine 5'-diphospho)-2-C-methyl-D-erythritol kinase n=1 Tax=Albidovulum sp. TaxID=1872424 RepID=UPI002C610DB6|nr:4-(cytidine 5'-diphospho)-2-C-methyl-D-erythritol kinase [Albidovulum sp.]